MAKPDCAMCGKPKPEGWYHSYCRSCQSAYAKAYRKGYRKGKKQRNNKYYILSDTEKVTLYEFQQRRCGICSREMLFDDVQVDHCHDAGEVRGLLCTSCNVGLGYFKDSREYLLSAVTYLENWPYELKDLDDRSG